MARRFRTQRITGLVALLALVASIAASVEPLLAQTIDCARLPAAERDAARRAGRCVDSATPDPAAAAATKVDPRAAAQVPSLPVPDLRNALLNRDDARIGRFKLEATYRPSARPRDWVLEQSPEPGARLRVGGTLTLTLSDGSRVVVPNVVGAAAANAQSRLRELRLIARIQEAPGEPGGRVLAQAPAAGSEVARGSDVTLRVATGAAPPGTTPPPEKKPPDQLAVPNVVGLPYDDALQRLARFKPERSHRAAVEPGGQVIDQSPAGGTLRPPGAPVTIVLSDGSLTIVPDVRAQSVDRAAARVADAGLKLQRIDAVSDQPPGRVLTQAPPAGERVARGSAVRVQVASAPSEIELPNVVGMRIDAALGALREFAVTRSDAPANAARGEVIAQRPGAGTRIKRGAAVGLTVSAGQEVIEVPNVVESDVQSARARLSEFRVSEIAVPGRAPADRVIGQAPPAGTMHPPGGAVTLSISDGSIVEAPAVPPQSPPPPRYDWWLIAGGVGVLLLGAGILIGRAGAPVKPPQVTARAALEMAPHEARIDGAPPVGPSLQLHAQLERGEPTLDPRDPEIL